MPTEKQAATVGGKSDLIMTPDYLAHQVVGYFLPQISGRVLEPCAGDGAFLRAFSAHGLTDVVSLELSRNTDFFGFNEKIDWIITNPPWSLAREFAKHAYTLAHDIVWLINTGHFLGFRARLRDCREAGFGVKEALLCDTPKKETGWPQSGFQLGALHFRKAWTDGMIFSVLENGQVANP